MGKKDVEKVVQEYNGILLKYTDDIFEKIELRCKNNHIFSLYENDINMGNGAIYVKIKKRKLKKFLIN